MVLTQIFRFPPATTLLQTTKITMSKEKNVQQHFYYFDATLIYNYNCFAIANSVHGALTVLSRFNCCMELETMYNNNNNYGT